MRTVLRVPRVAGLVVLVLAAALAAGLLAVSGPPTALAQTTAPTIVRTAPLTSAQKAAALASATRSAALAEAAAARQQAAAARQARAARIAHLRTRIVAVARKQVGDRYSAGSSGPSAFDCSGLTRYVYKVATGRSLPHHSRAQYAQVKKISRAQARPGDLVFFFRNGAHHVGVYIGKGRMIDAAGYGKGVRVSPVSGSWWSRTYSGMGRLLPA